MNLAPDLAEEAAQAAPGFDPWFEEELEQVAEALREALGAGDLAIFYRAFRASRLPFVCGHLAGDTEALFRTCFEVVHRLGGISPAVGLAVENHYYVTSAIATFPADRELARLRERVLTDVVARRRLVANTNSKVHGGRLGEIGTRAVRDGDGYRIDGEAAYASLASEADLLVVLTEAEGEGLAIFVVDELRDNPAVSIGSYLFPRAMIDSDTRRLRFDGLRLPAEALAASGRNPVAAMLVAFEMAWHQALIGALYLGAAAGAIEEVRRFAGATEGRDGRPLAMLDGMVVDAGRLAIDYVAARCAVEKCGGALAAVRRLPRDTAALQRASTLGGAAKYNACRTAEAVVTAARRIVGARSFAGGSPLERLSAEVMFGALGPEVGAVIERRLGKQIMDGDFSTATLW